MARKNAFFTGNVLSHCTHITRFYYNEYVSRCEAKQIEPKAHPPEVSGKNKGQKMMDGYMVAVKKPDTIPPVTKAGLKKFLLELIHLVYYLNLKVKDTDIPKQTCMSDAVMHKVEHLDDIDTTLVENISSLVSIIWDGWSSKCQCPFSSYSIQYIDSSPNDPYNDLVGVVKKFGLKNKLGWLISDNVSINDIMVCYICKALDPTGQQFRVKEICGQ
ncbi:hypothetical protein AX15_007785 [Amanita polypyramis BW_CC]|nr:hypothetical protein AX15_007785 [Amanita polypyramis BW_CC]